MHNPHPIDVEMHGHRHLTSAYLLRGERENALVDCGPAASADAVSRALERLGVARLDWIVLTHLHLDHAGAAGILAQRHPEARVAVHPAGARHVVDPSRLWAGVSAVYGADAEQMWGRPVPIAQERVVAVESGAAIDVGGRPLRAVSTPGHARHHHTWLDEWTGAAFVGDAVGMQSAVGHVWRATTPPAAFDLPDALASIDAIRRLGPNRMFLGHAGAASVGGLVFSSEPVLDHAAETLQAWCDGVEAAWRRGLRHGELTQAMVAWLGRREAGASGEGRRLLDQTSPIAIDVAGVVGWLERREAHVA